MAPKLRTLVDTTNWQERLDSLPLPLKIKDTVDPEANILDAGRLAERESRENGRRVISGGRPTHAYPYLYTGYHGIKHGRDVTAVLRRARSWGNPGPFLKNRSRILRNYSSALGGIRVKVILK
jgi:hypothetical protein